MEGPGLKSWSAGAAGNGRPQELGSRGAGPQDAPGRGWSKECCVGAWPNGVRQEKGGASEV